MTGLALKSVGCRGEVELEQFGGVYNATDPDLSAFRAHGGKLIMYQGWADQAIPPFSTIDYYAAVEKTMGGFASTQGFSRLYMVPGGYHCLGGGAPAVTANFLTTLVSWVEKGQAPGCPDLPGHHSDNRVQDRVVHRAAARRCRTGAARQRAEQQLPLHRDQQRVQSGADLVHARRFHYRLPDSALATGRAGG
ncbi:MAG: tannase/feruloyl esterase family alpha/beta hydrolase [Trebonia sp.]